MSCPLDIALRFAQKHGRSELQSHHLREPADVLVGCDLIAKTRKQWGVTYAPAHHLDSSYFQCLVVDSDVYLAPKAALGIDRFRPIAHLELGPTKSFKFYTAKL
jgi:hypothetical protein